MRRLSYSIGYINRYLSLRFVVTTVNRKGEYCISETPDTFVVGYVYPSVVLTITDELRDPGDSRKWSVDKQLTLSRFSSIRFVEKGKQMLRDYKTTKDLYRYGPDQKLYVDKTLANSVGFSSIADFGRRVFGLPVVGKDPESGEEYEGIALIFGNVSNHVVLTYDEFLSLLKFLDDFDFDGKALALINLALSARGGAPLKSPPVIQPSTETKMTTWGVNPTNTTIPKL